MLELSKTNNLGVMGAECTNFRPNGHKGTIDSALDIVRVKLHLLLKKALKVDQNVYVYRRRYQAWLSG